MNILVTGGAGYIGSHTLIELYKAGHTAVVVDNLSNSNPESLRRVAEIIGMAEIPFYKVDIRDREGLERVFSVHKFDACIHFAGLKAVGESVEKPWEYYENNIAGTLVLVDVMRRHGCKNIIFSGRRGMERRAAALLQPRGGAPERQDRREPQRYTQQPDALHHPGGRG